MMHFNFEMSSRSVVIKEQTRDKNEETEPCQPVLSEVKGP